MTTTVTIRDATMIGTGTDGTAWMLPLPATRIILRDLIRSRVYSEVQAHNAVEPFILHTLVPSADEQRLNGVRLAKRPQLNPERQFQRALELFAGNGFFVLVNDQQVDDLDTVIEISLATSVTFLKLVPLVGG
jgi:hypothetical protein